METLEHLRRHLDTMNDLDGIVRTMKALAAVSIRQYESAVHALADYACTVETGLHIALQGEPQPKAALPAAHRPAAVVFGSDHGLCGRFNEDVAAHAASELAHRVPDASVRTLAVGARVQDALAALGREVETTLPVPVSPASITGVVRRILLAIDEWRSAHRVDRVYLFHNRPSSGATRSLQTARLLPADLDRLRALDLPRTRSLPMHTLDRDALLRGLLQQYFFISIFRACVESLAAESASRLAAMQSAEQNLAERRDALTGELRRRRQEAITDELLDVVSGYQVLRGDGT